jgi:hypothetical protein
MILIVEILLSVAIAGLIHELGHYLVALTFGHHLVFRRQGIRWIWDMPEDTEAHQRLIALSGFGTEILFAPLLYFAGLWLYPWVVAVHLMAYPFYAGESNDFKWLDGFVGISKRGWMWVNILALCVAFWYGIYKIVVKVI